MVRRKATKWEKRYKKCLISIILYKFFVLCARIGIYKNITFLNF